MENETPALNNEQAGRAIFVSSLAAGAAASFMVDAVLFPIDSLKTRLQDKSRSRGLPGLQKLYRGLPVIIVGNTLGSATFFATYEQVRVATGQNSLLGNSLAAIVGELVAATFRTPAEIIKQRMQALQVTSIMDGLTSLTFQDFVLGFRAAALRDLVFSALQYPAYEQMKLLVSQDGHPLSAWEAGLCGSVTGTATALLTAPLDVVKTRIMLSSNSNRGHSSVVTEVAQIYHLEGIRGFMRGATCRALWMGLGGLVFLGTYEKVKGVRLSHERESACREGSTNVSKKPAGWEPVCYAWFSAPSVGGQSGQPGQPDEWVYISPPRHSRATQSEQDDMGYVTFRRCWVAGPGREAPGSGCGVFIAGAQAIRAVTTRVGVVGNTGQTTGAMKRSASREIFLDGLALELLAGGVAGCAVDIVLHPIDTLKTRLQASTCFWQAGGFHNLWRGVSAPASVGMPASGIFWASYVPIKESLYQATGSHTQSELAAGPISETMSLLVRVPSEVLKQRMQVEIHGRNLLDLVSETFRREGFCGFYAGFFATCCRSVPFALVQFPIYEELKRRMEVHLGNVWWTGGVCGALAGGVAACVTTPQDVIKTRIMLSPAESRLNFTQMASHIMQCEGVWGFFAGALPRSIHLSLGGMVYLGVYNVVANYFRRPPVSAR